jgi:ABC-type amino acid transport system permease subunit
MRAISGKNYESMVPYICMALVYILLVIMITLLIRLIEKLFAKSDRKTQSLAPKKKSKRKASV